MSKKILLFLFVSIGSLITITAQNQGTEETIINAITKQGQAFIKDKNINSVSIGIYKAGEVYTQHFGELVKGQGNTPTNQTIYEIASVTKTMAGYLVAKAVLEEKISLSDDVRLYLDGAYPNLEFNQQPITIQHLLTHTSGLPLFLPMNMNGVFEQLSTTVPETYYALEKSYNKAQFLEDLKTVMVTAEPGTTYSYSNAGAELIGHVLETVYQKNLDALFEECFLQAYGMQHTGIVLNDTQKQYLAQGYWMNNEDPSPNQLNTLWAAGSGAKMNLNDMMAYIKLQLNSNDPIVTESHQILFEGEKLIKVAYFWRVWHDKYGTSYNHHGGTSGMQNHLFLFPKYDLGISIITNQSGPKTPGKLSGTARKILKSIIKA